MKFQTIRATNKNFMGCQTLKSGQNDRSDVLVLNNISTVVVTFTVYPTLMIVNIWLVQYY